MRWARDVGGLTVCSELVNPGLGRAARADAGAGAGAVRTPSFTWSPRRRLLAHRVPDARIDNDLGDLVVAELVGPGLVDDFEAAFAGVVTSTAADPLDAWERFYAQTLDGLAQTDRPGCGAIATFGAIYRHALSLVVGERLLDAGSCFGFFCLLAAAQRPGLRVTGSDVSAPTVALASRLATRSAVKSQTTRLRIDHPPRFAVADVRAGLPVSADTVTALHVLEHLQPHEFPTALGHLCAAARRRVVVAVPLEAVADPAYGHQTAFADLDALHAAAAGVDGWRVQAHEHRGGWLVLDRLGVAQTTGVSRSRSRSRITPALVAPGSST